MVIVPLPSAQARLGLVMAEGPLSGLAWVNLPQLRLPFRPCACFPCLDGTLRAAGKTHVFPYFPACLLSFQVLWIRNERVLSGIREPENAAVSGERG